MEFIIANISNHFIRFAKLKQKNTLNMKRLFSLTILAIAALAATSCGDPIGMPLTDTSLTYTTWRYNGYDFLSDITFLENGNIYHQEYYYDDGSSWDYRGSYGFDGINGSAILECFGQTERFTFTVYGNRLTVDFEGERIVHERIQYIYPY